MAPVACCQGEVGQAGSFRLGWGGDGPASSGREPLPGLEYRDVTLNFPKSETICLSVYPSPQGPGGW